MTDSYASTLNAMTSEDYWEALVACGWVAEVPEGEQADFKQRVQTGFEIERLAACIMLYATAFDAECIYDTGPDNLSYHDKLEFLAECSRGLFTPANIHDELDIPNRLFHISFEHGGRDYRTDIESSKWFDPAVIALINQALADSHIPQRYIELPTTDQVMHLALVPERVYLCAQKRRLIAPREYFFYERHRADELNRYLDAFYAELDSRPD